jgi:hypothetical protein
MMPITIKASLLWWAVGLVAAALLSLGGVATWYGVKASTATAALEVARAELKTATGGLAECGLDLGEVTAANAALATNEAFYRVQFQGCELDKVRVHDQNAAAVRAAEAARADADATLARFVAQFRAKPPSCAAALAALDSACPTLEGY